MMSSDSIEQLTEEIKHLRDKLNEKEKLLAKLRLEKVEVCAYSKGLSPAEITRYSRQILVPEIGLSNQLKLKESRILIVGVGGLGCPAALYLTAAGIGNITLVDYDEVELSNLHRQVLHTESTVGEAKVNSAYNFLKSLNSNINIIPIRLHFASSTIKKLFDKNTFDVVIDGSDNVATRYLLNDICVMNKIPLVSGSALQMEGQLTVYNHENGPCYRCLFPVPPPPQAVTNCGDGGVLGVVPGVIGILQALETIKILTHTDGVLSGRLLIFDATTTIFRNVKLRSRNAKCEVCGDEPNIKVLIDYEQFCGMKAHDKVVNIDILDPTENISVNELVEILKRNELIIDVRPEIEFEMCKLPNTRNFPYSNLEKGNHLDELKNMIKNTKNVYVLCRRGNDSQRAIKLLKENLDSTSVKFLNVRGGLHAYAQLIDRDFPIY